MLLKGREYMMLQRVNPLSSPVNGHGLTIEDTLESRPDVPFGYKSPPSIDHMIRFGGLSEREQTILRLIYKEGKSLREVGLEFPDKSGRPLSKERVHQIKDGALKKLRKKLRRFRNRVA